jgi:hypothetical protein
MRRIATLSLLFLLVLFSPLHAQNAPLTDTSTTKKDVVEISGVVVSNDSLKQLIPNCYVVISKRKQVTTTNNEGFFSIVAVPGDTLTFSHIGFISQKLWVPDTLQEDGYLTMVVLNWDRTMLDPVVVYPWPRPENFKEEFLAMKIPTTEYDIAQRNLAIQELKERAAAMGYDAAEMQDYVIGLQNQALYNQGRYYGENGGAAILGAITNPFAWAEFFEALKRGDFKSK